MKKTLKNTDIILGKNEGGNVVVDIKQNPHILIVGDTATGKTKLSRSIIKQMEDNEMCIKIISVEDGKLYVKNKNLDEESTFTDLKTIREILESVIMVNNEVVERLRNEKVRDIEEYNAKHPYKKIKRMGILIDNLDSILVEDIEETLEMKEKESLRIKLGTAPTLIKESEKIAMCLSNLTRLSRIAGVNMIYVNQSEKNIPRDILNSISVKIKTNPDGKNSLNLGDKTVEFKAE
ncbi:FtsK/SpoIIIE domain-containing protein (plasmid) [Clostridium baratii]